MTVFARIFPYSGAGTIGSKDPVDATSPISYVLEQVNTGTIAGDMTGDTLRVAFNTLNSNFTTLNNLLQLTPILRNGFTRVDENGAFSYESATDFISALFQNASNDIINFDLINDGAATVDSITLTEFFKIDTGTSAPTISNIITDNTLADNSDTSLSTTKAIKAYVDNLNNRTPDPTTAGAYELPVVNSSSTGLVYAGPAVGHRNMLACGDIENILWADGTSFSAPNDDTYVADQWTVLSDGNGVVDIARGADLSIQATVNTASKKFGLIHFVHASDARRAIGKGVSAYVRLKRSGFGDLRMSVLAWTGTDDVLTSDVVSSWNSEGTNPTLATNWQYQGSVTTISPASDGVYEDFFIRDATISASGAGNIALFIWSDDTDTVGSDTLNILHAVLELGPDTQGPERLPQEVSHRLQRFNYEVLEYSADKVVATLIATSSNDAEGRIICSPKRSGFGTGLDPVGTSWQGQGGGGFSKVALTSFTIPSVITPGSLEIQITLTGTPLSNSQAVSLYSPSGSSGKIRIGTRL